VNQKLAARVLSLLLITIFPTLITATAQNISVQRSNRYQQTNLVSDVPEVAANIDRRLVNPWGVALSSDKPFRVADNGNGQFTSYDDMGDEEVFSGIVADPRGDTSRSHPTGVAFNPTGSFIPHGSLASPFLFASADGTISGEYADSRGDILETTILVVDNSAQGAVYTGLAILTPSCCAPFLAVANFHDGFIETYTGFFAPLGIPGAFIDPQLPSGYSPFNIQVIGNQVFVTYAAQDQARLAPLTRPGDGIVDIFSLEGSFIKRFTSHGELNAPWGVTKASAEFGAFSNDILIANFGDGTINAYNPNTGAFAGRLKDGAGNVIAIPGLHGLVFGAGSTGDPNTLYFTAGVGGEKHGLFGAISVGGEEATPALLRQPIPEVARVILPCQVQPKPKL